MKIFKKTILSILIAGATGSVAFGMENPVITTPSGLRKRCLISPHQAFIEAARRGDLDFVRNQIAQRPDIVNVTDENGETVLHAVARYGYAECIRILIAAGADVNAINNEGHSPFYNASGHTEALAVLRAAGARYIDSKNPNWFVIQKILNY